MVRQFALQGWQGPFARPLSQVSGYSTRPLPHAGHGGRQPGGWFDGVQMGWNCTSPGASGGEKMPGLGVGAPAGSVTKLRLVGAPPVVVMSAPASTRRPVRAFRVLRARASPRVSRRPVGPTWTVQPVRSAAAAPGAAVPLAWAWPLRVASPGKPNPPASRKIAPPLPPPCPPSASSVAAPPIERSRHASTSIMPPAFGPLADTFTGPFAVMFLPLATQSDPPSYPERVDVAAALTSGLPSTTSRPAHRSTAPSGPSARIAWAGVSSVMSESAAIHSVPHPLAALASMLPRRIARPSAG